MPEVRSLRGLSHHLYSASARCDTPTHDGAARLCEAWHDTRSALHSSSTEKDEGHIPPARSCVRHSRRIREFVEPGSDHPPTAGWMTVSER